MIAQLPWSCSFGFKFPCQFLTVDTLALDLSATLTCSSRERRLDSVSLLCVSAPLQWFLGPEIKQKKTQEMNAMLLARLSWTRGPDGWEKCSARVETNTTLSHTVLGHFGRTFYESLKYSSMSQNCVAWSVANSLTTRWSLLKPVPPERHFTNGYF